MEPETHKIDAGKINEQWLTNAEAHARKAVSGKGGFFFSAQALLDLIAAQRAAQTRIRALETFAAEAETLLDALDVAWDVEGSFMAHYGTYMAAQDAREKLHLAPAAEPGGRDGA